MNSLCPKSRGGDYRGGRRMETRDVVIAGYLRTAQSRSRPNDPGRDWLHKLRADDMLGLLLPELLKRTGVEPKEVDDCITGCAQHVGENFLYGGRMPVFLANFPETVPAKAVDQQCGSAMAAIHMGYMEIAMGYSDITIAAGMEHIDRVSDAVGTLYQIIGVHGGDETYVRGNVPGTRREGCSLPASGCPNCYRYVLS